MTLSELAALRDKASSHLALHGYLSIHLSETPGPICSEGGYRYPLDNSIFCGLENAVGFTNTLPLDSDLSGGRSYFKLALLLFCILVNRMASNCTNRVKYVDDATVMEFVPRLSSSYLNFTVSDIYSFASSREMALNGKKCKEMCISFWQYCPFPPAPLLAGSSLI